MARFDDLNYPQLSSSFDALAVIPTQDEFVRATSRIVDQAASDLGAAIGDLNTNIAYLRECLDRNTSALDRHAQVQDEDSFKEVRMARTEVEDSLGDVLIGLADVAERLRDFQQIPAAQQLSITAVLASQVPQLRTNLASVRAQMASHSHRDRVGRADQHFDPLLPHAWSRWT